MRIVYSFEGKETVFESDEEVTIGRPVQGVRIDLDLSPDRSVSRPHARIWSEDGQMWLEDLNSRHGTQPLSCAFGPRLFAQASPPARQPPNPPTGGPSNEQAGGFHLPPAAVTAPPQ